MSVSLGSQRSGSCPQPGPSREMGQAIRDIFNCPSLADAEAMVSRVGRFFRQLLLSSDGSPRWRRIGSLSKQTKEMPPDL